MEGLLVGNRVPNDPKILAKITPGSGRRLDGYLANWKLTCLNDDLRLRNKSDRNWMLSCGKAYARKWNDELAKEVPQGSPAPEKACSHRSMLCARHP